MGTWEENRAKEQADKAALIAHLIGLVTGVASELGPGWALKSEQPWLENGYVHIIHPDGRGLCFTVSVYHPDGKVNISGDYSFGPSEFGLSFPYGKPRPDINVAMARGATVIAKEIARRFLPIYNERFAEIAATVKDYQEYHDRTLGISERLGKLAGAKPDRISPDGFSTYHDSRPYVEIKVYSDVQLTIRQLTEEQAGRVLVLLNEL